MPEQSVVTCKEAATKLQRWAFDQGLIDSEPALSIPNALPEPVNDKGLSLLRIKQISHIGFNPSEATITVFLRRAIPKSKKVLAELPQTICGYALNYRQGADEIVSPGNLPLSNPPFYIRQNGTDRRYTCGSSISVGNMRDSGTLGCLVRDQQSGAIFGLSNNHVSGSCSYAQIGMPIVAPGICDVAAHSLNPFTIGTHHQALTMRIGHPSVVSAVENHDAAIFKIDAPDVVSSFQGSFYDTPAAVSPMAPGLTVEKVGRTTGHTQGQVISEILGPCSISYNASVYGFQGSVYFEPMFIIDGLNGNLFSDSGDSGSLITAVDQNGNRTAVGIVVGSMNSGPNKKLTIAAPIDVILQKFNVTLVSGHNL